VYRDGKKVVMGDLDAASLPTRVAKVWRLVTVEVS
jgi:hypothetical protein